MTHVEQPILLSLMETPDHPNESASPSPDEPNQDRRDFMQKAACVALGGVATLVPVGSAVTVLVSPLFEETQGGVKVRLTAVDSLRAGAPPQLFKVVTERKDAWTKHAQSEIGSVFVQRVGPGTTSEDFIAFNSTCPHLGCAVEFSNDKDSYTCPCHDSTFAKTGEVLNQSSPSPRGLDSLAVIVEGNDLWVEYLTFKANVKEKLPIV